MIRQFLQAKASTEEKVKDSRTTNCRKHLIHKPKETLKRRSDAKLLVRLEVEV
jgi:hypothetical protein